MEDPCGVRTDELSKRGANVLGVVVKIIEFGVVKDVERIDAELERDLFIERGRSCQ